MNLVGFNRAVVDEIEKITEAIKWPEIVAIRTSINDLHPIRVFFVSLQSEHCSVNYALTEIEVETSYLPIIAYTMDRLFDQLRIEEQKRARDKHDERATMNPES